MRKLFQIGGLVASAVLIAFGSATIYMGFDGRSTVRESLKQEQIVFGSADDPAIAKHASQWADQQVTTGAQARAFSEVIHEHALEGSGGRTYAELGRLCLPRIRTIRPAQVTRRQPSRTRRACHLELGPESWITATGLSTALNMSYLAEQMALFGIVVGFALLLAGLGFGMILGGALRHAEPVAAESAKRPPEIVAPVVPAV